MLFNSAIFAVFLSAVFAVYWFVLQKNLRLQNLFLICAGAVFYGAWDWRFLGLLAATAFIDYSVAVAMDGADSQRKKKTFLLLSIFSNLGVLGFFKYFDFFSEGFVELCDLAGWHVSPATLNIVLPVGLSFYTFQSLGYTLDVYHGRIRSTRDPIAFTAFISFFPQLVAGPIERAKDFLPQFQSVRNFDRAQATEGLRLILWGLFRKVVIADNCAVYVDKIFTYHNSYHSSTLLLGAVLFSIQIYCDFAGYSDIARGTANLLGFRLRKNFALPYFSRNIGEFWRRWHISLSTWFRDYLYIPLGGNRNGRLKTVRNVLIVFLLSGFWHGAGLNFIAWGLFHAFLYLPFVLLDQQKKKQDAPDLRHIPAMLITFLLVTIAWIFFRSPDIPTAVEYLQGICSPSVLSVPEVRPLYLFVLLGLFFTIEWLSRKKESIAGIFPLRLPRLARWSFYYLIVLLLIIYGGNGQEFIYFQF